MRISSTFARGLVGPGNTVTRRFLSSARENNNFNVARIKRELVSIWNFENLDYNLDESNKIHFELSKYHDSHVLERISIQDAKKLMR